MRKRIADLLGPSPYTGEQPQTADDSALEDKSMQMPDIKPDYSVAPESPAEEFNWSMSGTHVQVSPDDHNQQFQDLEWNNFDRPHAYGKLEVFSNWRTNWHIYYTNLSHHIVEKRLRKYTRDQGWEFGAVLDEEGTPPTLRSLKQASVPGIGEINPGLKDWKRDEWSGTGQYDNPADNQSDFYGEQDPPDEDSTNGLYTCSDCGMPCKDHNEFRNHIMRFHVNPQRKPPSDPQPVVDLDDALPAGFNEAIMDSTIQRQSSSLLRRLAASANQPMIQGPIPFIYDIETDRIFVGHPGERHSDIQGRFTPGGIVEGMYDPRGNVQIRTETDMPYTVRHMAELWYAMHPELAIKGIFLMQGEKKYKLASANIGHKVRNLVATDPSAWAAFKALEPYGNVYAVGGAVRDVVLGKTPKDIDLLVQGIAPDQVEEILEQLPGRVDLTGESFGVFRYRDPEGNDVEVALPRTERSTGPGHKDFEVYTDPFISVEEDLGRRDFTSNAMAVNLGTGELVDPYRGSEALKSGVLEPVSDRSFVEDPLRILRAFSSVSRHGLVPSDTAHRDLAAHASSLSELPQERLQMELDKIMSGDDPAQAITLMEETGVLQHVLPEVAATYGFDQRNKHHNYPLNEHLKVTLDNVVKQSDDLDVRWAALLHDIGKPSSQWIADDGIAHYYQNKKGEGQQHEEVGAQMAQKLLTDLKFPTERVNKIVHLIRHHMFPSFANASGARKFINKVGDEHADDLLTLRQADLGGKGKHDLGYVPIMQQYVKAVRDMGEATDRSQLAINGSDLINAGFKPGPEMGQILEYLTQAVLEDPSLNDKQKLLQMAMQSRTSSYLHVGPAELYGDLRANSDGFVHLFPGDRRDLAEDWLAERSGEGSPYSIYEVDPPGEVEEDPHMGAAYVHRGDIPRHCVKFSGNFTGQDAKYFATKTLHYAMADRSGIPEIDNLIEDFLKEPYDEHGDTGETFRDPEQAHGNCQEVTEKFVEFAKARGFNAYSTDTDMEEMGYKPSIEPFGEIGFDENEEMQYGFYPEHTVASIYLEGQSFPIIIDFTATQYGYTDHPKVSAVTANILDPIRDELDPTVFNHPDALDPDVRPKIIQWVKKKIYTTMTDAGWPEPSKYMSLFLTGSLTTYQWSGESDFDTSLWVDVERFPEFARAELIRLMIEECDGTIVPGTTHPIQCFVVDPTRFTKDDLYKPGLRSAYDLDNQRWFVLPEKERSIDVAKKWPEHIRYARMVTDKMKLMLRYGNNEAVKIYWRFLHRQRFLEMRAGGSDYSLSNIVYKMLANEGLFGAISEATGEHIA